MPRPGWSVDYRALERARTAATLPSVLQPSPPVVHPTYGPAQGRKVFGILHSPRDYVVRQPWGWGPTPLEYRREGLDADQTPIAPRPLAPLPGETLMPGWEGAMSPQLAGFMDREWWADKFVTAELKLRDLIADFVDDIASFSALEPNRRSAAPSSISSPIGVDVPWALM